MGEAAHGSSHGTSHGQMDISDHRATFSGFIKASEWGTVLTVALVALLTVAFAMGLGWFPGLMAFLAIAVIAGLLMRMGAAWWVTIAVATILMTLGGGLVSLIVPAGKTALLALPVLV